MEWNRIAKVIQKVVDFVEKGIDKVSDTEKETPKATEIHVHAKDESVVQPEKKKIPFPINSHRKTDTQSKAELD